MLNIPVSKSSKCGIFGLITVIATGAVLFPMDYNPVVRASNTQENSREHSETNIIVPGVGVGDYKLGMSKDEVLKSLGKPKMIFHSGEKYTLDNLPRKYFMVFDDISFGIVDDFVEGIAVLSPLYKFANGLGVGDPEQKIKQAFGTSFHLKETEWKDFLSYEDKGLEFEIHKKNRTVMEISITKNISRGHRGSLFKPIESVKEFEDVRWKNMSKLDLSGREGLTATLNFNQKTVWPQAARMPAGPKPNELLTMAMNPGLGVRELHRQGITGKGVNVAIIDQPLYQDHPEFAGKIAAYHDVGCGSQSSMHGPAVASLLVGTNCGTAPYAKVYYAAAPSWTKDTAYQAKALNWIIEQNKGLPSSKKIRVVSVSAAPSGPGSPFEKNQQMWDNACNRAEAAGILVLDCTSHRGFIEKCWYDFTDPENVAKCVPGQPGRNPYYNPGDILAPASVRTVAEEYDKGNYGYTYYGRGGTSWTIPYCAGVLALGWQVNPELSFEQMRELLFESAYTKSNGAKIINPKKFIFLAKMAKAAPRTK